MPKSGACGPRMSTLLIVSVESPVFAMVKMRVEIDCRSVSGKRVWLSGLGESSPEMISRPLPVTVMDGCCETPVPRRVKL